MIRIDTVAAPLNRPSLLGPAIGLVRRALALGLLGDEPVERLDLELVRGIAREASSVGIGRDAAVELLGRPTPARLGRLIGRLDEAMADSPLPERELAALAETLGIDPLAELLGISAVSLRRYIAGSRGVPDAVALRAHWLALVSADLAGAYNEIGIRRWFERPRSALGGRSPRDVLTGDWQPDDEPVVRVGQLAAAAAGAGGAT
ncbi:MAG TPA: hypothetical protein VNW68_06775 [Candidatus Limnocylindria bacterium]|jgi:hypothetical protein|nr:hypothetical protein [Candidatus Limnocylindria bacterium]